MEQYELCNTDCARYRQGDCPFPYKEQRTTCPRWREALHPIEEWEPPVEEWEPPVEE